MPNPRFLFLAGRQREALSNLRYGLTTARGLTLLLGEAGTGKTTMLETVVAELVTEGVRFVRLSNPTLTRAEFYEFLTRTFGLPDDAVDSKTRFLFALRRELQERHAAGVLSALIIDEALSVPYELLEEIRLLSNIETTTTKLLNVVLAGQPELADRLNESSLRQLKQRISLRCELKPMDMSETASYIAGRVRIAGGRPEHIFTREAVGAIFDASQGIARTVNVVCDNALIGGFAAQVRPISVAFIEEVRRDFDLKSVEPAKPETELPDATAGHTATVAQFPTPAAEEPSRGDEAAQPPPMFGAARRKRRFSFF